MKPDEIATHLEAQAEKLEDLATGCDEYKEIQRAEECRKNAKETRCLAQQVREEQENVIGELEQLQQLINRCNNGYAQDACQVLKRLIDKFTLEKTEPYSTHLRNCGF